MVQSKSIFWRYGAACDQDKPSQVGWRGNADGICDKMIIYVKEMICDSMIHYIKAIICDTTFVKHFIWE